MQGTACASSAQCIHGGVCGCKVLHRLLRISTTSRGLGKPKTVSLPNVEWCRWASHPEQETQPNILAIKEEA